MVYILPAMEVASGNVAVAALVPVKIKLYSLPSVFEVPLDIVVLAAIDPCTSSVEFGVVVPIPTCAVVDVVIKPHKDIIKTSLIEWNFKFGIGFYLFAVTRLLFVFSGFLCCHSMLMPRIKYRRSLAGLNAYNGNDHFLNEKPISTPGSH